MAKQQRRLNKNLVAFLTLMGVVLVVSVATLLIRQGAKRDPELLARNARVLEDGGDELRLSRAAQLYRQAYVAGKEFDVKYLLDSARCSFKIGALGAWVDVLRKAHSQSPNDQRVLVTLLEGFWRTRELEGRGLPWWDTWREYSEKLIALDPNSVLALTCDAYALWGLGDKASAAKGDEAILAAYKLDPTAPRVAITYVDYLRRRLMTQRETALAEGATEAELRRLEQAMVDDATTVLNQAATQNPDHAALAIVYSAWLQDQARRARAGGRTEAADELLSKAGTQLEQALASAATASAAAGETGATMLVAWERGLPDLHLALAQQTLARIGSGLGTLKPEELRTLRTAAEEHVQSALKLDPAMYDAYTLQAQLELLGPDENPAAPARAEEFEGALAAFEGAVQKTQTLHSLRATLSETTRLMMVSRAFNVAIAYCEWATGQRDEQRTSAALARAQGFFDDVRTRWPEHPITDYLRGRLALINKDRVTAIKAFERTLAKQPDPRWWLDVAQAGALPEEQLASLYAEEAQLGEAERYGRQAIQNYRQVLGRVPPLRVLLTEIDVLRRLDRAADALELLDQFRELYANEQVVTATRAELLTVLKRTADAEKERAKVLDTGVASQLWQASQALDAEDYPAAEKAARGILDDASASDAQYQTAVQVLVATLDRTERLAEAHELVKAAAKADARPALRQFLQAYELLLSEKDPAKRQERLLEIIAQATDPTARAQQYCSYYDSRREFDKELPYVLELRKLHPEDATVMEREFATRLRLARIAQVDGQADKVKEQFSRIEELLGPLAAADGGHGQDQASGATYRGQFALAQGNVELALREFRAAVAALPKSGELQVGLARAYLSAGRTAEGIEALKRAITINPRNLDGYGLLTTTYEDMAARTLGAERDEFSKQAAESFEALAKLAPNHPFVQEHKQRMDEEADPQKAVQLREKRRAEKPDDLANVARLAELYIRAWAVAAKAQDAPAQKQLAGQADAFYAAVLAAAGSDAQLGLLEPAASFYSVSGQRDKGEALLQKYRDASNGAAKISVQLLLARFLESIKDIDGAEREYQRCQGLVEQTMTEPADRQRQTERVGMAFLDFYERSARPVQVVEVCRWLLDRLPEKSDRQREVRMRLIDALLRGVQLAEAEAELNQYVKSGGEDLASLAARGRVNLGLNRRDTARQDLANVLEKDPENQWALLARGWLSMQRAQYDEARADLMKAKDLIGHGNVLEGRLNTLLASLYERTGQVESAITTWRSQLGALEAANAPVEQRQQVTTELVRLLRKTDQFERARDLVSGAMELHPSEPNWPYLLAELLENRADTAREKGDTANANRDYLAAVNYYARAIDKIKDPAGPTYGQAMSNRLNVLVKAGKPRDAIDLAKQLQLNRPAPALRVPLAKAHAALNEREAADDHWRRALADGAAGSMALLGTITVELRQAMPLAEAEAMLRSIIELAPAESLEGQRLRIALAEHLVREEKLGDSLQMLNSALEKCKPDSAERVAALLTRAQCLERMKDIEPAIASYREALQVRPDYVLALNNLAYLLVSSEGPGLPRPQEALKYAERLESLMADNADASNVLDTVGWVYFKYATSAKERRTYLERAVAALEQAIELDSERNLAAYQHLGQVYREMNRMTEARSVLNRGLSKAQLSKDETARQGIEKALRELQ